MDDYQDRVSITTPEGLELHLVLAGPGTRILAALLDLAIRVVAASIVLGFASGIAYELGEAWEIVVLSIGGFAFLFLWDPWLELAADGRTPGKALLGLRVVRDDGRRVDPGSSLVRNLLRIVEYPLVYLPGIAMVLAHPRHQRIGDLVAGTYVIRQPYGAAAVAPAATGARDGAAATWDRIPGAGAVPAPRLDLAALGELDRSTVRAFVERRDGLQVAERERLAATIAGALRPRVGGIPPQLADEELIEAVARGGALDG